MQKSAKYHPEQGREVEFNVLSENDDKTVNLGVFEDGKPVVVVSSCRITDNIEIGAATLSVEEPETKTSNNKGRKSES